MSTIGAVVVLALSAFAGAPSASHAQGTAAGPPPPSCELLSQAEAEAIISKRLERLGPLEFGPNSCAYTLVGEANAVLYISYGTPYQTADQFYHRSRNPRSVSARRRSGCRTSARAR